jgi:hypothetical protein
LNNEELRVFLLDSNNDGIYTKKDRWSLVPAKTPIRSLSFADAVEPVLLKDESSWILQEIGSDGGRVVLAPTGEKELAKTDPTPSLPRSAPRLPALQEIFWIDSLDQGAQRAEKEEKWIFLLITSPSCEVSRSYLETTFRDAELVELMGCFVPVHLVEGEHDEAFSDYHVPGFPFSAFLDASLKEGRRRPGFRTAPEVVKDMKRFIRQLQQ